MPKAHNDVPTKPWWKRAFAPVNVISVAAGLAVFVVGFQAWDTNQGVLIAAILGALVAGVVWLILWTRSRPPSLASVLDERVLGRIPEDPASPAPTLSEPGSETSQAYHEAVSDLEAHTTGQVVLVTSSGPGQGSTTVAMNMAIAATQAGRRVLLIDGDSGGRGLSRFMGTGPEPGLTDLAAGEADLGEASRLWRLSPDSVMPVVPAGSAKEDAAAALEGEPLADAIGLLTDQADLVLIDSPPILWNGTSRPLAAHADGTVLVVTDTAQTDNVVRSTVKLELAGAPVVGYVVNRSGKRPSIWANPLVRMLKRSLAVFLVILLGATLYTGGRLWSSWRSIERDTFGVSEATQVLPLLEAPAQTDEELEEDTAELNTLVTSPPAPEEGYQSILLIGSDQIAGAADVILLAVLPNDGLDPFMVSLPRDLYIPNRCWGYGRINSTIKGCDREGAEEVNGPTLLALTVEDFTGIKVDHFAAFDFAGFESIIDGVGGVEICVENAVKDAKAYLDLPAGCTNATGAQALAWVRSRKTMQNVDGVWRSVPGAGDLQRNQHQQELILEMFTKLQKFRSPDDLNRKVAGLSDAFTLDDQLGLAEAISLAWQLRDLDLDSIRRLELQVRLSRTKAGQSVLVPTAPFADVLAESYPEFVRALAETGNRAIRP